MNDDIKGWTHSLEESERNYRSIAGCDIPECPWSEAAHAKARIIVALLDERDEKIKGMPDAIVQHLFANTNKDYCDDEMWSTNEIVEIINRFDV